MLQRPPMMGGMGPPGPGGMPPPNFSVPPPGYMPQSGPPGSGDINQELWVETKTAEGKVVIYCLKCIYV